MFLSGCGIVLGLWGGGDDGVMNGIVCKVLIKAE